MQKSPDRIAIEKCLKSTTKTGMGVADIALDLGIPIDRVKVVVRDMRRIGQLISIDRAVGNLYRWDHNWAPKAKPQATVVMGSVKVQIFEGVSYTKYVAPRDDFYRARSDENKLHGSRRGSEVVPYAPPISSMCVGKLNDPTSHVR